jgi:hypothetical protein
MTRKELQDSLKDMKERYLIPQDFKINSSTDKLLAMWKEGQAAWQRRAAFLRSK